MKIWSCKVCGQPLKWGKSSRGRWMPIELNGENHLAKCRKVGEHAVNNLPGITIESVNGPIPEWCCPDVPPWEPCIHQVIGIAPIIGGE